MSVSSIAITMGDPAGVGPELCLRVLDYARAAPGTLAWRPVVIGDARVLQQVSDHCPALPQWATLRQQLQLLSAAEFTTAADSGTLLEGSVVIDCNAIDRVAPGVVNAQTGAAAHHYIDLAIQWALARHVDGIATGPIHKEALWQAGQHYPGHTELLAERTQSPRYCMMLTSDELTCSFVTTHVGYSEAPLQITQDRIIEVARLTADALNCIHGRTPRLLVCALNPHAGENGLFGNFEEERIISPAIEALKAEGFDIDGPLPPDTAFLPWRRRETDGFICMYHDQGHIPLKALAFDEAVNVTLGLPIVRTSVDHGTALDIAWRGIASPTSFLHAVELASELSAKPRPSSADHLSLG